MSAPKVTVVGRLTNDPELRFTPSGQAVCNFTIASNDAYKNKDGEWVEKPAVFLRANAWRDFAENIAETLVKGAEVIAIGSLSQREYEKDGEKKTIVEFEVDTIGPSLRQATAKVTKAVKAKAGAESRW